MKTNFRDSIDARRLTTGSAPAALPRVLQTGAACALFLLSACGDVQNEDGAQGVATVSQELAIGTNDCYSDPRVTSGLVSHQVCVGARVFFDETFNGNGRTCGSCHPAGNNFTIDVPFIASLDNDNPLFVGENNPSLAGLETNHLRDLAVIKEHVDDFEDEANKFTIRSVPHVLSMSTSIARDPADETSASFVERTGWSGDGVAGGALRHFTNGAIKQHLATDLARAEGSHFRAATGQELDAVLAFTLALGRTNELDLPNVTINDSFGEQGRIKFLAPEVGNCNTCHSNAGANRLQTGLNTNFDAGTDELTPSAFDLPTFAGVKLQDGGFGGQGLFLPNFAQGVVQDQNGSIVQVTTPNSFGDGTFNTPSLIEAADTAPFFHHNGLSSLEGVIATYTDRRFTNSPAFAEVGPVTADGLAIAEIAQFLRILNAAFNLSITRQRLEASELLNVQYWDYKREIQRGLITLASAEIEDALQVMVQGIGFPGQQANLQQARADLATAATTSNASTRLSLTRSALTKVKNAKATLGTNLNFTLGQGNLMF